jgi:MFS family permease
VSDAGGGLPGSPFESRGFVILSTVRLASVLGMQVQSIGVAWLIYTLTGSVLYLGYVGLAQFAPTASLALFTGHAADRWDRRRILAVCYTVQLGCAAVFLALVLFHRAAADLMLAILVVFGASRAFENPAGQSLLPNVVPRAVYPRALAWNASAQHIATIVGPALGGLLFAVGPAAVFAVAGGIFTVAAVLTRAIPGVERIGARAPLSWASLLAGLAFIRSRPEVLGAISLDLFAVLLGGATALLPAYARDILHIGPVGLGVLRSAPAVGALGAAVVLAHRPLGGRAGRTMFIAVAGFGFATIVFGLSTNVVLSFIALMTLGVTDTISVVVRQMLLQMSAPDAMRGRVAGVSGIFVTTSNQLGEFESGVTAAWFGVVPAVIIGGVGTLLVTVLWAWRCPALRRVDRLETIGERS